jgi:GTP cyclohydrolase II
VPRVRDSMDIVRYATSRLPTAGGEFRIFVYRTSLPGAALALRPGADEEHVAMVMGDIAHDNVLTRVHSSCFTGEVLGSLRCDCRAQLDASLAKIAEVGSGVVVYLVQEGRGIGLGNKVKAYALQDQGVDTVDANLQLGFEADQRSYGIAAGILRDLGVRSVRLMTNNPAKIDGLVAAGMPVVAHEAHWASVSEHAADYVTTKIQKMGHLG